MLGSINNRSTILVIGFFLSCLIASSQSLKIEGTLILQSQNFERALSQFQYLLVYFSSKQCGFCGQFDMTFAVLEQKFRSKNKEDNHEKVDVLTLDAQNNGGRKYHGVHFAKIYHENSTELFKKYGIESVPSLKMFKGRTVLPYEYQSLDYDELALPYVQMWIERLVNSSLPQWKFSAKGQPSENPIVIVPCDSQLSEKVHEMSRKKIDTDFYCTNENSQVSIKGAHEAQFTKYSLSGEIETQLENKINYHSKVVKWGNDTIHKLFSQKKNMYVLLVNTEKHSDSMLRIYRKIREEAKDIPELFVYANLQDDIQGVSKLRQFIGTPPRGAYPYPLLAYITHGDGRVMKYTFGEHPDLEHVVQLIKNQDGEYFDYQKIKEWMYSARKGDEKQHFKKFDLSHTDQFYEEPTQEVERIHFDDLEFLLSDQYQADFAVYLEWKNDHLSNYVEDSVLKRFPKDDLAKEINVYVYALSQNDLPPVLQKRITKVPAMVFVDKQKNIELDDNIKKYDEDVIPFLKRHVKPYRGTWYYDIPGHKRQSENRPKHGKNKHGEQEKHQEHKKLQEHEHQEPEHQDHEHAHDQSLQTLQPPKPVQKNNNKKPRTKEGHEENPVLQN